MWVEEYCQRMQLRKLGFTDSLDTLDALTGEYFCEIDTISNTLTAEELEKNK